MRAKNREDGVVRADLQTIMRSGPRYRTGLARGIGAIRAARASCCVPRRFSSPPWPRGTSEDGEEQNRQLVSSATQKAARRGADDNTRDDRDIRDCLAGHGEAYARLVQRYEKQIAAQMWRFSRDPTVCEELVQEAFVEAYFSLAGFRGRAPFLHWLRRIASRVGYRFWKKKARETPAVSLAHLDRAHLPHDPIRPADAGELLHGLLAQLPPADRLVLTLTYLEGCTAREAAARMGWSRAMVKMRSYRARKKLRTIAERAHLVEELGWTR